MVSKPITDFCPFCNKKLTVRNYDINTSFLCLSCLWEEDKSISYYYVNLSTNGHYHHEFIIDSCFIRNDYEYKKTTISKLEGCFLFETIFIPFMHFDFSDLDKLKNKIKMYITFS